MSSDETTRRNCLNKENSKRRGEGTIISVVIVLFILILMFTWFAFLIFSFMRSAFIQTLEVNPLQLLEDIKLVNEINEM